MVTVGWILFGFGMVRLMVALYNMAGRPYLPSGEADGDSKRVSVLVPARNEEENIGRLLEGFKVWRDEVYELVVYDDMSADRTFAVAARYSASDGKVKVLQGSRLPAGWLGKNHACHRLSLVASGDILLFVDADVTLKKSAVVRSVNYMEKYGLQLLSVFPRQIMDNPGSRLTVPLMNWILLSLLPLKAVRLSPRPSLAAANGQFMMFTKGMYDNLVPHSRFRNSAVEDIAIIKFYKREGARVATLLGRDDIGCRMYNNFREAVDGFSKNIFDFFGGSVTVCLLFVVATTVAPFWIFIYNGPVAGWSYLTIIIAVRISVSVASRQNTLINVLSIVPQHIVLWIITLKAAVTRRKKNLTWKGRNIYRQPSS
ncbi:MAG: glycosyltransferase family 2 protein [Alistipes sp.]|nr:glycosyltransferase family 2 protein [Alistipes sp.]